MKKLIVQVKVIAKYKNFINIANSRFGFIISKKKIVKTCVGYKTGDLIEIEIDEVCASKLCTSQ